MAKEIVDFRRKKISRKVARKRVGGCVGCAVLM
jgi:hypothetical protein